MKILDLYKKNQSLYLDFTNKIQEFITALLLQSNIRVHAIVSRIKGEASLENKLRIKNYTNLEDITDLCGLRIITYFEDDVDKIADILRQTNSLAIDDLHSVDKRNLLPANQFGYSSLHLVATLGNKELKVPAYQRFKNCKIEIQICSILQHAWAEIEHDLGYKSATELSYETRRRFSRLAGLLETADIEFRELRSQLQPLPAKVPDPGLATMSVFRLPQKRTNHPELLLPLLSPAKEIPGYTLALMSILLAIVISHFAPALHLISPLIAALKTKAFLFS
ncbi:hypothetical protein P22_0014 [Propionispora sp. 2/2-37]|uniref:GTP pyrophosphokinase n=1 Tax=Propionispora sp. 2/2-37 TaxID=1677858 RepID=UPI0006BB606E|nr:hypothetical protein [Propionispora sp. 2/2-37]CUH93952.1 hypothetical protein P22_0014 [Propionispora sp. 2/2-37]